MTPRILILGGGISGLTAAHRLTRLLPAAHITLAEATERFGGVLGTLHRNGFLLERAADAWLTRPDDALNLAHELGLADQIIRPRTTRGPGLLLYARGRVQPLPLGTSLVLPTRPIAFLTSDLLSLSGRLRAALEPFVPAGNLDRDQSMGAFFRRRLGTEFVNAVIAPILAGIYSGNVDEISIQSTFPRFPEMVREHGSLFLGARAAARARNTQNARGALSPFVSFRRGMSTFIDALVAHLESQPSLELRKDARCTRITQEQDGYTATFERGETLTADHILLAMPSYRAATLLNPWAPGLAAHVGEITYTSTAAVFVALDPVAARIIPASLGMLMPRKPEWAIKGVTFMSNKYHGRAPLGHGLLRLFVGGVGGEHHLELSDDAIVSACLRDLHRLFGLNHDPLFTHVQRHRQRTPQYRVGHQNCLRDIEAHLPPGLHLAGSAYYGIGVPACVARAEAVAQHIAQELS